MTAKKATARKTAPSARKKAVAKKGVSRVAAKKVTTRKAATRTGASKKAASGRSVVKKAATKKVAAKKNTTKKTALKSKVTPEASNVTRSKPTEQGRDVTKPKRVATPKQGPNGSQPTTAVKSGAQKRTKGPEEQDTSVQEQIPPLRPDATFDPTPDTKRPHPGQTSVSKGSQSARAAALKGQRARMVNKVKH
ncbi:MAG: hypothetical protein IPO87_00460 [Flavobacteriales bacterium]|nr:hypothetical protein [Flavobacteriales bacterium]